MKIRIDFCVLLLAIGALSCTQPREIVSPAGAARQGSLSPPTPPATPAPITLPTLTPNPNPINDLRPILPSGSWTVKSYYRGFSDITSDFAGCRFVFYSDGSVTVTDNKGKSVSGSWYATVGGQVVYYGAGPSITSLTMNFGKKAPKPFDRLTNTFNVNLATTTTDVVVDNFEPLAGERIEFGQ